MKLGSLYTKGHPWPFFARPKGLSRQLRSRVAAFSILLTLLPVSFAWADQAYISYASGKVEVGKLGQMKPGAAHTPVAPGETVTTGADSTAILTLPDGSEIKLNSNTEFTVRATAPRTDLTLEKGSVFSKVKKLKPKEVFRLRAKTVVMGIRGTEFFTSVGDDVWMCVHDGIVDVEGGKKKVAVKEGEGVYVKEGKEITPPKAYDWTKGLNWNMDPKAGSVVDKTKIEDAYDGLLKKDYD